LRYWNVDELRSFLEFTAGTELALLWHLAAMTGMRRGELLALRASDIDFDNRRISVTRAFVSVANEVQVSTPKAGSSRVVDLDEATCELLRSLDRAGDELVFADGAGNALHPDAISKLFQRELHRSGLHRIRFHDLRHTHATLALRAGVPVKVISERLGHESPAFTLRQYAHVLPGMQAEAAELVARAIAFENS
jgi:integrase